MLATLGRLPEAAAAIRSSTEIDPKFFPAWRELGRVLTAMQDYRGARQALQRALAIDPDSKSVALYLGVVSLLEGDPAAALAVFQKARFQSGIAMAECDLGHAAESTKAVEAVLALPERSACGIGQIHAFCGDREQAIAWLDRAIVQHAFEVLYLKYDPLLRKLHGDTRYAALLAKVGLPQR